MYICTQPYVVSQIPAGVVRIFIEHDIVGAPVPVPAIAEIGGCDAEIKAAEPESLPVSSLNAEDMPRTEAAGEMAVLPNMVEMVTCVIFSGLVAHPLVIRGVHVGSFRMAGFIGIRPVLDCRVSLAADGRGPVRWNMTAADVLIAARAKHKGGAPQ